MNPGHPSPPGTIAAPAAPRRADVRPCPPVSSTSGGAHGFLPHAMGQYAKLGSAHVLRSDNQCSSSRCSTHATVTPDRLQNTCRLSAAVAHLGLWLRRVG